jgi:hypothetical protein
LGLVTEKPTIAEVFIERRAWLAVKAWAPRECVAGPWKDDKVYGSENIVVALPRLIDELLVVAARSLTGTDFIDLDGDHMFVQPAMALAEKGA